MIRIEWDVWDDEFSSGISHCISNHRFVIALHSPSGVVETGLRVSLPEKKAAKLGHGAGSTLSLVRFEGKSCGIAGISSDFQGPAAEFLCNPDCVAERGGFEPSVQLYISV